MLLSRTIPDTKDQIVLTGKSKLAITYGLLLAIPILLTIF